MFLILLLLLLLAAALHAALSKDRSPAIVGRLVLLYVLVGYCGLPGLPLSVFSLREPTQAAEFFGFQPGGAFQTFFSVGYLGMSLLAVLALVYRRGAYLVGPAVLWATFFAGATFIHMREMGRAVTLHVSGHGHADVVHVFATHGLISLLLVGGLVVSGEWRRPRAVSP